MIQTVFQSPPLFEIVVSYQNGVYEDVRPVIQAMDPLSYAILHHATILRFGWSHKGVLFHGLVESLDNFRGAFAPWYAIWGPRGLSRLVECLPTPNLLDLLHVYGAWTGDLTLVPTSPPTLLSPILVDMGAWYGHLHVLAHLEAVCPIDAMDARTMDGAAALGHLDVVAFLHRRGGRTSRALNLAASNGHLDIVRFLHEERPHEPCTKKAMDSAAGFGHLDIVRFLHAFRGEGCTRAALDGAAAQGHMDVVRFLLEHRSEGYSPWGLAVVKKSDRDEIAVLLEAHPHMCVEWQHDMEDFEAYN
ncbi:Aste57867_2626 [Aphanomyces stellatus]|uniref:Aste57867_2626 protein n=1 Tax=Aphanomyces stellatus TaxID=120398 RepID=A0A485KAH3_9STRA|nr:hypothetical protein As57867_002619 [Aphanomyces stellatus]VFT79822.1 Aste57867_2626 [Aphanomyces stellatus]